MNQTSFQSRLSAKLNKLSQRLIDNSIRLSGTLEDAIRISTTKSDQGDIIKRKVEDLTLISAVFPALQDVPLKLIRVSGDTKVIPYTFDIQPFEILVPLSAEMKQDDLVIKFYENTNNQEPFILVSEVKEVLGTFGSRSILYHKYKVTGYDGELPSQIIEWVLDMARRRDQLQW